LTQQQPGPLTPPLTQQQIETVSLILSHISLPNSIKAKIWNIFTNPSNALLIQKLSNTVYNLSPFIFPVLSLSASLIIGIYIGKRQLGGDGPGPAMEVKQELKVIDDHAQKIYDKLKKTHEALQREFSQISAQNQELSQKLKSTSDEIQRLQAQIDELSTNVDEDEKNLTVQQLKEEMATLRQSTAMGEAKLNEQLKTIQRTEERIHELESQVQTKDQNIAEHKDEIQQLQGLLKQKNDEIAALKERNRLLTEQQKELAAKLLEETRQKEELKKEFDSVNGNYQAKLLETAELKQHHEDLSHQLETLKKHFEAKNQECEKKQGELDRLLENYRQHQEEKKRLIAQLRLLTDEQQQRIKSSEDQFRELLAQNEKLSSTISEQEAVIQLKIRQIDEISGSNTQQSSDIFSLQQQILALMAQLGSKQDQLDTAIAVYSSKQKDLSEEKTQLEGQKSEEIQQLRNQLEELRKSQLASEKLKSQFARDVEEKQREISQLKETISGKIQKISSLESQLQSQRTSFDEARAKLQSELDILAEQIAPLNEEIKTLKRTKDELNENIAGFDTQLSGIKKRNDELEQQLVRSREEKEIAEKQNRVLLERLEAEEKKRPTFENEKELGDLRRELAEQRELLRSESFKYNLEKQQITQSLITQLRTQYEYLATLDSSVSQQVSGIDVQISELLLQLAKVFEKIQTRTGLISEKFTANIKEIQQLTATNSGLQSTIKETLGQLETLRKSENQLNDAVLAKKKEVASLETKVSDVEEQIWRSQEESNRKLGQLRAQFEEQLLQSKQQSAQELEQELEQARRLSAQELGQLVQELKAKQQSAEKLEQLAQELKAKQQSVQELEQAKRLSTEKLEQSVQKLARVKQQLAQELEQVKQQSARELEQLQKQHAELKEQLKRTAADLEKTKEQALRQEVQIQEKNLRIQQLSSESQQLHSEIGRLQEALRNQCNSHRADLQQQQSSMQSHLEEKLASMKSEMEQTKQQELRVLQETMNQSKQQELRALQETLQETLNQSKQQELGALQETMNQSKQQELDEQKSQYEQKHKKTNALLIQVQAENLAKNQEISRLTAELERLQASRGQLESQFNEFQTAKKENAKLTEQHQVLFQQLQSSAAENLILREQFAALELKSSSVSRELSRSQQLLDAISKEYNGLKGIQPEFELAKATINEQQLSFQQLASQIQAERNTFISGYIASFVQLQAKLQETWLINPSFLNDAYQGIKMRTFDNINQQKEFVFQTYLQQQVPQQFSQAYREFVWQKDGLLDKFVQRLFLWNQYTEIIKFMIRKFDENFWSNVATLVVLKAAAARIDQVNDGNQQEKERTLKLTEIFSRYVQNDAIDSLSILQDAIFDLMVPKQESDDNVRETLRIIWNFIMKSENFESVVRNQILQNMKTVTSQGKVLCQRYEIENATVVGNSNISVRQIIMKWMRMDSMSNLSNWIPRQQNMYFFTKTGDLEIHEKQLETFVDQLVPDEINSVFLKFYLKQCLKNTGNFKQWCFNQSRICDFYIFLFRTDIPKWIESPETQFEIMKVLFRDITIGNIDGVREMIHIETILIVISTIFIDNYIDQYETTEFTGNELYDSGILKAHYKSIFAGRVEEDVAPPVPAVLDTSPGARADQQRHSIRDAAEKTRQTYVNNYIRYFDEFYRNTLQIFQKSKVCLDIALVATLYNMKKEHKQQDASAEIWEEMFKNVILKFMKYLLVLFYISQNGDFRRTMQITEDKSQIESRYHQRKMPITEEKSQIESRNHQVPMLNLKPNQRRRYHQVPMLNLKPQQRRRGAYNYEYDADDHRGQSVATKTEKRNRLEYDGDDQINKQSTVSKKSKNANSSEPSSKMYIHELIQDTSMGFLFEYLTSENSRFEQNVAGNAILKYLADLVDILFTKIRNNDDFWRFSKNSIPRLIYQPLASTIRQITEMITNIETMTHLPNDLRSVVFRNEHASV
jgi:chromosome segregation ATPase